MDEIEAETEAFDIIALTEMWLHNNIISSKLNLPGYQMIMRKDRDQDRHGGVIFYSKDNIIGRHRVGLDIPDFEATWAAPQMLCI